MTLTDPAISLPGVPNRAFQLDQHSLAALCEAHGLGTPRTVDWAARGRNNPTLIVNDAYVIRFNGLDALADAPVSRFYGEQRAYAALKAAGIPAPEVIAVDTCRTLVPQDFMVMTRVAGRPVIDTWGDLTPAQRERLAVEAGEILARMHAIPFETYGRLYGQHEVCGSWRDYIEAYFARYAAQALAEQVFDRALIARLERALTRHSGLLDSVTEARLIHWDYHFENILQQDGRITGVLDFEWALSGDPAYDLRIEQRWEETCPGSRAALYAGYRRLRPLPDDLHLRLHLYRMVTHLDFTLDAADDAEAEIMRGRLMAALEALERAG
ncbi:MAG: phosphotransferase [Anaerolineae bacterium]|nr:phosphotransferase [Anaerolineae bacterium]